MPVVYAISAVFGGRQHWRTNRVVAFAIRIDGAWVTMEQSGIAAEHKFEFRLLSRCEREVVLHARAVANACAPFVDRRQRTGALAAV